MPVPGRTVSSAGTKVLFLIWMTVTATDGVAVAEGVAAVVATLVSGAAVVAGTVAVTLAGKAVVGMGVLTVVATSVGETGVVGVAVASLDAVCGEVHPLNAARSTIRMNKPIYVFMK